MDSSSADEANRQYDRLSETGGLQDTPYSRFVRTVSRVSAQYPELSMRLWAEEDGMHLSLVLYKPGKLHGRPLETLAEAVWQPVGVTEAQVLQWAGRALAYALAKKVEQQQG